MKTENKDATFSELNLDDYEVPPLPKEVDNRGYLYMIRDSAFPDFIKIGRTINIKKRLMQYNADKPYPTASLVTISKMFLDANMVEKKILEHIYKSIPPTTFSKEWFEQEYEGLCISLILKAEETWN